MKAGKKFSCAKTSSKKVTVQKKIQSPISTTPPARAVTTVEKQSAIESTRTTTVSFGPSAHRPPPARGRGRERTISHPAKKRSFFHRFISGFLRCFDFSKPARDDGTRYQSIRDASVVCYTLPSGGSIHMVTLPVGTQWFIEPMLQHAALYYRTELYDELWDRTNELDAGARLLVIGNAGIGKSWSLNAMLWRHLMTNPNDPVVVRDLDGWYFIDHEHLYRQFPSDDFEKLCGILNALYPDKRRVLLLHDCKTNSSVRFDDGMVGLYHGYAIVLASSPDKNNYASFRKSQPFRNFYMQLWTFEELVCVNPSVTVAEFEKGGGVPQLYDQETGKFSDDAEYCQNEALANFPYTTSSFDCGLWYSKASRDIIAVLPDPTDRRICMIDFVSDRVRRRWFQACYTKSFPFLQDVVVRLMWFRMTRIGAGGYIFEAFMHLAFEADPAFDSTEPRPSHWLMTKLERTPSNAKTTFATLPRQAAHAPAQLVTDFSSVRPHSNPHATAYYRPPTSSTFPSFDALYVVGATAWLIQVTLAKNHPVKAVGFKSCYDQLITNGFAPNNICIIFITDDLSELDERQQCDITLQTTALALAVQNQASTAEILRLQTELNDCQAAQAQFDRIEQYRLVEAVTNVPLLQLQRDATGDSRIVGVPARTVREMYDVYYGRT